MSLVARFASRLAITLCLFATSAQAATLSVLPINATAKVSNQTAIESQANPTETTLSIPGASATASVQTGKISGVATTTGSDVGVTTSASAGGVINVLIRNDGPSTLFLPRGFITFEADASLNRFLNTPTPLGIVTGAGNAVTASLTISGPGLQGSSAANVDVNETLISAAAATPNSSSFGNTTEIAFFGASPGNYLAQFASQPFSIASGRGVRVSASFDVSANKTGPACPITFCDYAARAASNGGSTGALTLVLPSGVTAVDGNGAPVTWAVSSTPAPVPLPAAFPLLAFSILGMFGLARRDI